MIDALSVNGSAWSRPDIMRVLCDTRRPVTALDGTDWADALGDACRQAVGLCVELDPTDTATRRQSDGRSVWLEPISAHLTSHTVLAEEERVLDWAADAQAGTTHPSRTVDTEELDVLQAHAAAAVAGHDRLVLVVGPAGAGKTSALRSAVADLTRSRRRVLGLAPSAKAARVLATETGVQSDTVAKLLHEWARTDRLPGPRFLLRGGDTVLVDEAGMIGTNALARLVDLVDTFGCRLVLVGDHRQLQAVGRGGLFEELCLTGHRHELQRVHRFDQAWEAAASLRLRHGNPAALDAYETNARIIADTFDGHFQTIAQRWIDTTASGDTIAITASTNDHVDAINAAIQHARVAAGQLDSSSAIAIAGGERAHPGDVHRYTPQRPGDHRQLRRSRPQSAVVDRHLHAPRRDTHRAATWRRGYRPATGRVRP